MEVINRNILDNNLVSDFSISDLYDSYKKCKKGKKSINLLKFEENLEENLINLSKELNSSNYHISRSICFVVLKPKIREIWANDFRDRVVHHLVVRPVECYYENQNYNFSFLNSSFANRNNKGAHKAILFLKKIIKQNKYYLKLDIKSFFNSIDRKILYDILYSDLKNTEFKNKNRILELYYQIIFHKYTINYIKKSSETLFAQVPFHKSLFYSERLDRGLPIGNLTSQFLANVYLNKLDYFIEKRLGFKKYIRYVDDFLILSNDKEQLKEIIPIISKFLNDELSLELNSNKTILGLTSQGVNFLGYYVKSKYTLVRKNVTNNVNQKIYPYLYDNFKNKKRLTQKDLKQLSNILNSYFGHFKYANSYNLKFKMVKKLNEYFRLEKKSNKNTIAKLKNDLNFKTFWEQYMYFKNKYKNYLIVFQMGNFYRCFDAQAEFLHINLDLKIQEKKYSHKKHLVCGFPVNSKKIYLIDKMDVNYIVIKQLENELTSGLKERQEVKIVSNKSDFKYEGGLILSENLNSILDWDLNSMTPIEVFIKLSKLINTIKHKNIKNEKEQEK